jgi:hypothetical protein
MYATIRRYVGNTTFADELAARSDEVKAVIEPVQGFRAYYMVRGTDGATSITVCDDQAGAEESNQRAAAWVKENMPELAAAPPEISAGEVVVSAEAMAHA